MPSPVPDAIKQVSAVALTKLREIDASWKRKAPHLLKQSSEGLIQGVHFQSSQFNSGRSGTFTVNLVITEPRIYRIWAGHELPANPVTALYPIQQRIGRLLSPPRDHWWEIEPDTNIQDVSSQVCSLLLESNSRFFDGLSSLPVMLERIRQDKTLPGLHGLQPAVAHAVIASVLGYQDEAISVFRNLLSQELPQGFRGNMRMVAKRAGIEI